MAHFYHFCCLKCNIYFAYCVAIGNPHKQYTIQEHINLESTLTANGDTSIEIFRLNNYGLHETVYDSIWPQYHNASEQWTQVFTLVHDYCDFVNVLDLLIWKKAVKLNWFQFFVLYFSLFFTYFLCIGFWIPMNSWNWL